MTQDNVNDVVIIGAGLSGLCVAHFLLKENPALRVVLLEQAHRAGGAVETFKSKGFQGEWGPHGFLDNTPESQELLRDTGLYAAAQKAPLGDFYRYVCHHGRIVRLPQSPKTVLTTPLVSFWGKLRVLAELWKKPKKHDMTIGDWVAYRFGAELLPLVDAAVTGSFAGDYTKLSIDAVMPGARRLEFEYGSLLRGLMKKKKAAKGKKQSVKKMLPSMMNFPDGMEYLIQTVAADKKIVFETAVEKISKNEHGWLVDTSNGDFVGKNVVMAIPVNGALKLLSPMDAPPINEIPVSRINNVVIGLGSEAKIPYGFGYLAPEREGRFTLGAMFTSHMFPDRAPKGQQVIEALVGGRRHPERLELDDETIIEEVWKDINQLIELPEKPLYVKVLRSKHGIPQLEMNHPALLQWRKQLEAKETGLYVCGFGWDGIGMNDMIKSAKKSAQAVLAGGGKKEEEAKVKPVYF